ncbi:helix-turn-helix domain-containing protein [Allosphingosinicella vermicomposti]|uniref:helix-turn-helix domain-containing protein n=1 Tax=Allosphingosinicella vermicomposti TaxID=614671 RepID=UPI000D105ACE|nr:helix-turn-helix domain-containing protein [Allosphingosinicella vermicomposti]
MVETEEVAGSVNPIGDRLKAAREAKGISLDDLAAQTRIPIRHLEHIEQGSWDALPAITYSVGFARTYANAVGLDGNAIGAELREELGATRTEPAAAVHYEPADPARVPPKSLALILAVVAIILVAAYLIWRSGAIDGTGVDESQLSGVETAVPAEQNVQAPVQAAPTQSAQPSGPVVLTATEEVWLRVYEAGGARLYEATMQPGQTYEVPATATRPQILTGKPQAVKVTIGGTEVPPLGEPERTISDVSLLAADLIARDTPPAATDPAGQGANPAVPAAGPNGL